MNNKAYYLIGAVIVAGILGAISKKRKEKEKQIDEEAEKLTQKLIDDIFAEQEEVVEKRFRECLNHSKEES